MKQFTFIIHAYPVILETNSFKNHISPVATQENKELILIIQYSPFFFYHHITLLTSLSNKMERKILTIEFKQAFASYAKATGFWEKFHKEEAESLPGI